MTGYAVCRAKKKQSSSFLVISQRVLLAARKPVKRCISKNQRELELGNGFGKHVIGDRISRFHFWENLAEKFSVLPDSVDASDHFVPNSEVVTRKNEARSFDPLSWRNERLGDQQVRFV